MKKWITAFLLIACSLTLTFALSACDLFGNSNSNSNEHVHMMDYVEARPATEYSYGNVAYYYCTGCGNYYLDEDGTVPVTEDEIYISPTEHTHTLEHREQEDASCEYYGNIEYWYCTRCGGFFTDEQATNEVSYEDSILIYPTGHTYNDGEVTREATCTETGVKTYTCTVCGDIYGEIIPATGHTYNDGEVTAEATCTETGVKTYTCTDCGDEYHEIIFATGQHHMTHAEAKDATCTEDGNIEYWYCSVCGYYYNDENATSRIYNVTISASHSYDSNNVCTVCGEHRATSGLEYTTDSENGGYSVGIGTATAKEIYIPSTYNGLPVTSIAYSGFKDSSITSVTIPESVVTIKNYAFYGCKDLTTIYYNAAWGYDLASGNSVFGLAGQNGDGVTLYIGASVRRIPEYLFSPYTTASETTSFKLTSVVFEEDSGCLYICKNAFAYCLFLTSVTIPDSVTYIGVSAFMYCPALTSVTIGEGVTEICDQAFQECKNLTTINYNAVQVEDLSSANYIFTYAGKDGSGISVTIGAKVKRIPTYLFYPYSNNDVPNITSLTFEDNSVCESIGQYAFYSCSNLTQITKLPTSITLIEPNAFSGTNSSLTLSYVGTKSAWNDIQGLSLTVDGYTYTSPLLSATIIYLTHELTHHNAVEPTCTTAGNIEYWYCSDCEKYFSDEACTTEVTQGQTVLSARHTYSATWEWSGYESATATLTCVNNDDTQTLSAAITSEITTAATCASDGLKTYTATVTYEGITYTTTKEEVLSALPHTGTSFTFDSEYHYYVCTSCGNNITEAHTYENGVCKLCGYEENSSAGLSYTLSDDKTYYTVSGIGTCTDTNIAIPSTYNFLPVSAIAASAFNNRTTITSVRIPASITSIGDNAFKYCYKLVEVYNLSALTITAESTDNGYVGYYALNVYTAESGSSNLLIQDDFTFYKNYNDTTASTVYYLVGYAGSETTVVLPTLTDDNGNSLSYSIYKYAFYEYTSLTSITISENVTSIGDEAFSYCTGLTEIKFNATAMEDLSLSSNNFYRVGYSGDGITVTIGANVTKIPACLFYDWGGAPKITSIVFENNSKCENIGSSAFRYLSSLKSISFGENSALKSIESYAFYDCSLESVTIPEGVTTIGSHAFYGCSLTSITIPSTVTSIGSEAFYNCTSLTEINFNATAMDDLSSKNNVFSYTGKNGDGITVTIGANVTKIPAHLFNPYSSSSYAPKITSVIFEDNSACTSIGTYAFYYCTLLTSITIPENITSIGTYAFYYCTLLTSITIPENITSIGTYAFYECTALTEINFNATAMDDLSSNNYVFYCAGQSGDGITVTISANVTKIPAYFFDPYQSSSDYAPKITSVVFKDNSACTSIGTYAFSYCIGLTSITIPENITSIETYAFYECTALTEINFNAKAMDASSTTVFYCAGQSGDGITVTVGANVTKIPDYLFEPYQDKSNYAPNITSVVFEENSVCTSIGNYAFYNCSSLANITLGNSITSIGIDAFTNTAYYNDSSKWEDDVLYIGSYLITANTTISGEYEIKDGTLAIANYAFRSCKLLTGVKIPNSVASIGEYAFSGCILLTSIQIPDSVVSIKAFTFNGCSVLTSVTLSSNILTIDKCAFNYCSKLTSITLPECLTFIGEMAFMGCSSLTGITIPKNVTSIGGGAFYNCSKLTTVSIGNSVTFIDNEAFYGCTSLTSAIIGKSLKTIGDDTFKNCSSLSVVYYDGTASDWTEVTMGSNSSYLTSATLYYYSESQPTESGNYWHYVDGVATVWTDESAE